MIGPVTLYAAVHTFLALAVRNLVLATALQIVCPTNSIARSVFLPIVLQLGWAH